MTAARRPPALPPHPTASAPPALRPPRPCRTSKPNPCPEIEQTPLGGKPPGVDADAQDVGTGVGSWGLQTAMALGVVVLLIVLVRQVLRRLGGAPATGHAGLVEVMARVPIAPRTHVLFLRIGERVIIAGQTQAGLNTLAELDDPDDVASVLAHVQASRPASITEGFGKLMRQFDRGFHQADDEGGDSDEHVVDRARHDVSGLLTRIRNLNRRGE